MKRIVRIIVPVFVASWMFTSCDKNVDDTCYPLMILEDGNPEVEFFYENNDLHKIFYYSSNGLAELIVQINRDNLGIIENIDFFSGSGTLDKRNQIIRNSDGKIAGYYEVIDVNQDGYPETVNAKYEYYYSGTKIDSIALFTGSSTYSKSYKLLWNGDNVTRLTELPSGDYTDYTYDTYRSFFQPVDIEAFIIFLDVKYLSNNNTTSASLYNSSNVLITSQNYTYTYNEDDLPDSMSPNYTFDYTCHKD